MPRPERPGHFLFSKTNYLLAGLEHHFHAAVLLVAEDVVAVRGLAQGEAVSDDVIELHIAICNVLQQLVDVLVGRRLPGLNDDALIENLAQREVIERRGIHAQDGYEPAPAHGADAGQHHLIGAFFEVDD